MLRVEAVSCTIRKNPVVKDITFVLRPGEILAILGANGAGKSTLMRLLCGERTADSGTIKLYGKSLGSYNQRELARRRATLSQHNAVNMAFTCHEIVMMGRYPHYDHHPTQHDHDIVLEAMNICGVEWLAERSFLTLSGGEQQRVQLARVLAQLWDQPQGLLLLDEPLSGMDMLYQYQTLAIIKALSRKGIMVVAILHEINLAAGYADRILMMKNGRRWREGTPSEVLTPLNIYTVFSIETEVIINAKTLNPYVVPKEITLNADHFNSKLPTNKSNMTLKERYAEYKAAHPRKRIRDIATDLNVSEAALLLTSLGTDVTLLEPKMEAILEEVHQLGYVMALTRNEDCVHERKGVYHNFSQTPHAALFLGEDIDLRLFLRRWSIAVAVNEKATGKKSLQFFNAAGMAIHKIHLTDKSNHEAFDAIVSRFKADNQQAPEIVAAPPAHKQELPDEAIDVNGFQSSWEAMTDTHEFFGLLQRYKLSRTQALRLAPASRAKEIGVEDFKSVIATCSEKDIPVMVFTGNEGCIQIHTGKVKNLVGMGPWYNIMDPEFNLHLHEDAIASAWHVSKPSSDGDINSIELFDKDGEMIVQFFGKRKPGIPELEDWRQALDAIAVPQIGR